jgi:DNA-directed RNA polymerase specialized sigma24 family protein
VTLAEVEVALNRLTDNQIVQGELLGRVERVVVSNAEAIGRLTDRMDVMQSAMERLFEHMDRFVRGLEGNGHRSA